MLSLASLRQKNWRGLHLKSTLILADEKRLLESALDGLSFSCGSPLQEADLNLPDQLLSVRELRCGDPVKALYYTADYTDICVHCSSDIEVNETPPEFFFHSALSVLASQLFQEGSPRSRLCVCTVLTIVVYTLTCVCGCVTSSLWYNLMTSYPVME